jgi:thiol-disulfide isomerase/thioredoxin
MIKKIVLFFSLLFLLGFKLIPKQEIIGIINLTHESNPNIHLDFTFFNRELKPISWAPKIKENIKNNYKGIPNCDSLSFYLKSENPTQYKYDLYKNGGFDKLDFLKFISKYHIDTTALSKKPLKQGYIAVIGFYQDKQFIIADLNRNENFGDDIRYEFDINFRKGKTGNEEAILSKLPSSKYTYETFYNGNIHTYTRELIFYPATFEPNGQDDKKEIEYLSKFRYRDYWKGEKLIDNKIYEFYYQAVDNNFGAIFIKPKNILFKKNDEVFNNQFRHLSNDTIMIGNTHYKIDSINRNISKLYFKQLYINEKVYGNTIGGILKNYTLEDLQEKSFKINEVSNQKKYTLLEFWGTWCAPCLELTQKLKKIAVSKSSKCNIISIAVDDDPKKVAQYVKNKKMNWSNAFIDINSNSFIRKELQIEQFPTIILIDSNNNILYRGGSNSLESISKLIK